MLILFIYFLLLYCYIVSRNVPLFEFYDSKYIVINTLIRNFTYVKI